MFPYRQSFILFLFLAFLSALHPLAAQVCGDQDFMYAFVLHPFEDGQESVKKDLQILLVDENHKPYTRMAMDNSEPHIESPIREVPLQFIFNKDENYIQGIGENYFLVIHEKQYSTAVPVYIAAIIYKSDTAFVRLPYGKSLNVCANHLLDRSKSLLNKTLRQVDGEKFVPIAINLNSPTAETPLPKRIQRVILNYHYDTLANTRSIDLKIAVNHVDVVEHSSLQKIQTIVPSKKHYFYATHLKESVKELNVMRRQPIPVIKDLVIITGEQYHGKEYFPELHHDYWLWDTAAQQYRRNALLSDYANVHLTDTFPMRYWISEDDKKKYVDFWSYQSNDWKHVRQNTEHKPPPVAPRPPLEGKNCIQVAHPYLFLPVQFSTTPNTYYLSVQDSFPITNHCDVPIRLDELRSADQKAFILSKRWAAGETAYLNYKDEVTVNPNGIYTVSKNVYLKTVSDYGQSLSYEYYVAGANTIRRDPRTNKITHFEVTEPDSLSFLQLWIDEKGRASAYGKVLRGTNEKVGEWIYFSYPEEKLVKRERELYKKQVQLMFLNDATTVKRMAQVDTTLFQLRVLKMLPDSSLKWVPYNYAFSGNYVNLYIDSSIVGIRCTYGTDYDAEVRFIEMSKQARMMNLLAWVKKGTPYYFSGGAKTPVNIIKNNYTILWDPTAIQDKQQLNNYQMLLEKEMQSLSAAYPQVKFSKSNTRNPYFYFNLGNLDSLAAKKILKQLLREKSIRAISILIGETPENAAFSDHSIFFQASPSLTFEELKTLLAKYHFGEIHQEPYTSNYYSARYYQALVDEEMIRDMYSLSVSGKINSIHLNMYLHVEMDDGLKHDEIRD